MVVCRFEKHYTYLQCVHSRSVLSVDPKLFITEALMSIVAPARARFLNY
jgi:hypothetical protein